MDFSSLIVVAILSSGALYFVIYRGVFYHRLKWKMIHSIWLPITVAGLGIVSMVEVLMKPGVSGSMAELGAVLTLIILFFPVISFFGLYFIVSFEDKRKNSQ